MKKYIDYSIVELVFRIWAAFYIFIYGAGKLVQFDGANKLPIPINEASNSQIMWAFFGATVLYPLTIGCLQMLGAILLTLNKTKLIGAILLTPVFLNIIFLDILYQIDHGALLNAILFQVVLFLVIIKQKKIIKETLCLLLIKQKSEFNITKIMVMILLLILLFVTHQMIV